MDNVGPAQLNKGIVRRKRWLLVRHEEAREEDSMPVECISMELRQQKIEVLQLIPEIMILCNSGYSHL
jgi:hypothetical protein